MQRALLLTLVFAVAFGLAHVTRADSSSDIQAQINAHNQQIAALNADIAKYQAQLDTLGKQKSTLQTTISSLSVSQQKISTSLKVTQNQIGSANLKISQLSLAIGDKQSSIVTDRAAVALSLRQMNQGEDATFVEQLFAADTMADAWRARDEAMQFNLALQGHVSDLAAAKAALAANRAQVQDTQSKLVALKTELTTEQHSLEVSRKAQQSLLTQTKNQESTYQKIIAQKRAEEAAFERDIFRLSEQLKAADTGKVPPAGKGILSWPLDTVRITQLFGKTSDSGRLYASGTHNGIDFALSVGTPVHAALAGTVMATNAITAAEDKKIGYCQYGSWVLIKHADGLATLYAHLSEVSVSKGDSVTTGQTIGYGGQTGYATGPHLHLTVYNASSISFTNYKCATGYTVYLPVAPTNGYLDPLSYL